jgi:hypothetical protein
MFAFHALAGLIRFRCDALRAASVIRFPTPNCLSASHETIDRFHAATSANNILVVLSEARNASPYETH